MGVAHEHHFRVAVFVYAGVGALEALIQAALMIVADEREIIPAGGTSARLAAPARNIAERANLADTAKYWLKRFTSFPFKYTYRGCARFSSSRSVLNAAKSQIAVILTTSLAAGSV